MRAVLVVLGMAGLSVMGCGTEPDRRLGDAVTTADEPVVTTTVGEDLPPCEGPRHLMLFMFDGVVTPRGEFETWHGVEGYQMRTLPGASALATAYHERGLEIVYIVRESGNIELHGVPSAQAIEEWLSRTGFPTGDRVTVLLAAGPQRVLQEMVSATVTGGSVRGAYVSDSDLVTVLVSGGAPRNRIYSVGDAGSDDTSTIPGADLTDHALHVAEKLEPICKVQ